MIGNIAVNNRPGLDHCIFADSHAADDSAVRTQGCALSDPGFTHIVHLVSLNYGKNLDRDRNEKTFAHLENHVTEIFPQLAGIGFTHRWGGPVSVTLDMAPVVGYLGDDRRAIFSMGCIGHGVSMTTLNGRAIAELICGEQTERTEMFFVGRKTIPWPPEPLAYGISQAVRGL